MINEATLLPKGVSNLWGKQLQRWKLSLTPATEMGGGGVGVRFLPSSLQGALRIRNKPPTLPPPTGLSPEVQPLREIKRLATQTCRGDQNLLPVVLEMY